MKSIFASSPDTEAPPASVSAGGWDRVSSAAKIGIGAAVVLGVAAMVVLPGIGENKPAPVSVVQANPGGAISDYSGAPPSDGVVERIVSQVVGPAPSGRTVYRRSVPTEMGMMNVSHASVPNAANRPATSPNDEGGRAVASQENGDSSTSRGSVVHHPDYVIGPGTPVQCLPMDAQNSGLPGFTTCRTTEWQRGDTMRRGVIPPGTKFFGRIRQGVAQGQERIGVEFTMIVGARFRMPLSAPGADAMGRPGLEGNVETFFWDRAGAVALYSLFDVAIGAGQNLASSSLSRAYGNGGTTLNLGSQAQGLASQEMASRLNRPPVITRPEARPVLVTVGQDLDFYDICQKLMQTDPMACPLQ